jgi:hypothetical protein
MLSAAIRRVLVNPNEDDVSSANDSVQVGFLLVDARKIVPDREEIIRGHCKSTYRRAVQLKNTLVPTHGDGRLIKKLREDDGRVILNRGRWVPQASNAASNENGQAEEQSSFSHLITHSCRAWRQGIQLLVVDPVDPEGAAGTRFEAV